jgi:hypothetical protein
MLATISTAYASTLTQALSVSDHPLPSFDVIYGPANKVGQDGTSSTVKEIEGLIGERWVLSILRMRDLMQWLEENGVNEHLENMREYWNRYGLK